MGGTDDIDLSEFEAQVGRQGPKCAMSRLRLKPRQQLELTAAIERGIPSSAISKVLRKWGYNVSDGTLARHRRGLCGCGR